MQKLIALSRLIPLMLSGCAISKNVTAVPEGTQIDKIYIEENPNVYMEGVHPELVAMLENMSFEVESYSSKRPEEARFQLTYTANWAWDLAMYLTYFRAMLLDDGRILGTVEYDARMGGGSLAKFGKTAEKIRPLLQELLNGVPVPKSNPRIGQMGSSPEEEIAETSDTDAE